MNWVVHPVLGRQSSPAFLSCSPWLTSGRKEDEEMVSIQKNANKFDKIFQKEFARSCFFFIIRFIKIDFVISCGLIKKTL